MHMKAQAYNKRDGTRAQYLMYLKSESEQKCFPQIYTP